MKTLYKCLRLVVLTLVTAILTMIMFSACSSSDNSYAGEVRVVTVTSMTCLQPTVRMPQKWTNVYVTDGVRMYRIYYFGGPEDISFKVGDSLNMLIVSGADFKTEREEIVK